MDAVIKAIEYHLPEHVLTNQDLAAEYPDWSIDKIEEKTGISNRHIAGGKECSSDLGVAASQKLFASGVCRPSDIDFVLLCTQSPDYFLPTTACLVQRRLGIPTTAGALDFNLGCSGFIYGLALAKGLIKSEQANSVLLIMAETYSKFMHPGDRSVRIIFGDAGSAALIQGAASNGDEWENGIGALCFGTDGAGAGNLIVPTGGMRAPRSSSPVEAVADAHGNYRTPDDLYMNGPAIFSFTLKAVPKVVTQLLMRAGKRIEDIDLFVFHQASRYMLEHLRSKLAIPESKFCVCLKHCGNTVSSTIPIALKSAEQEGRLKPGYQLMLVGFGVGYSLGAALVRWSGP